MEEKNSSNSSRIFYKQDFSIIKIQKNSKKGLRRILIPVFIKNETFKGHLYKNNNKV